MLNMLQDLITTLELVLECVSEEHCDLVREAEKVLRRAKTQSKAYKDRRFRPTIEDIE